MAEQNVLCHRCGNIFRLPASPGTPAGIKIKCPQCGSIDVRELPSWVPLGSDLSETLGEWEYECQHCSLKFKLPVPGSPSLEKNIRCPSCDGEHIHRLTKLGYEPLYCG